MDTESGTLRIGLLGISAQEMGKQVIGLYLGDAGVRDFDAFEMKGFGILAQVWESVAVAEVKAFGTWVDMTKLFQAAGQSL